MTQLTDGHVRHAAYEFSDAQALHLVALNLQLRALLTHAIQLTMYALGPSCARGSIGSSAAQEHKLAVIAAACFGFLP